MLHVVFEENRQRILQLVWNQERSAGEIAAKFDTTFGAVSQHLKILRDNGYVTLRKEGRTHYYSANKKALGAMAQTFEALWGPALRKLQAAAEKAEARKRSN